MVSAGRHRVIPWHRSRPATRGATSRASLPRRDGYTGLNPEEVEGRLTTVYERVLTTTVDNIQYLESTTVNGQAIVKIFLQPHASLDTANAQVTAISQSILRQLPPGTLPPIIINYSASSVGLSEQRLKILLFEIVMLAAPGAPSP